VQGGWARIAREALNECVLLALIGGVAGIGVAHVGLRFLAAIGPANVPRLHEISFDARSIAFTLGLSLVSALLFGTIAALKSMRSTASLAHPPLSILWMRSRQNDCNWDSSFLSYGLSACSCKSALPSTVALCDQPSRKRQGAHSR